jgi:hypothetical protein
MEGQISSRYVLEPTKNRKNPALGKNVTQATKPVTRHYAVHKGLQKIDATPCNTSNGVALLAVLRPLSKLAINSFPCIRFVPDKR